MQEISDSDSFFDYQQEVRNCTMKVRLAELQAERDMVEKQLQKACNCEESDSSDIAGLPIGEHHVDDFKSEFLIQQKQRELEMLDEQVLSADLLINSNLEQAEHVAQLFQEESEVDVVKNMMGEKKIVVVNEFSSDFEKELEIDALSEKIKARLTGESYDEEIEKQECGALEFGE